MKVTLIHKLSGKLLELVREFLACFVKPGHILSSGKKLQHMSLGDKNNLLPMNMFLCTGVSRIINTSLSGDQDVHLFFQNIEKADVANIFRRRCLSGAQF